MPIPEPPRLTARDWTLLVIASAGGESLSPVQLQKALFLIARNLSPEQLNCDAFYSFRPYDYGPFDSTIYTDADRLDAEGFITIRDPNARAYRGYAATPAGLERAKRLETSLDALVTNYLREIVAWVTKLSFSELIRAIYKAYPEMKINSVFSE
ncbi:MAG TPA: hypothetical protein VNF29_07070 [Candidatus Binataceae bacterium]|nr:hypothetical protein [Candidatus Binataceae bacterium]